MTTESAGQAEPPIRVVVIDDSSDVRFLLCSIMELDGRFQVVGEATSAPEGITLVDRVEPDLVLVDLQLGARDGIWLIQQLRGRNNDAALAVVSGSVVSDQRTAAFQAGADSVHDKCSMTSTMADDLATIVAWRQTTISA